MARPSVPDSAMSATGRSPAAERSYLVNEATADRYRDYVTAGADHVAATLAATKGPSTGAAPERLAAEVAAVDLDRPLHDPAAALEELDSVYLRDAVYFHHPRYLAHLNCPVVLPALLGETVLSAVNSSLDTWDQSAGATMLERRMIDWTTQRIGLGPNAGGVFTSGGTQSNLQALLLARDEACANAQPDSASPPTPTILPRLRILTSECSHFSVSKAAHLLGLGHESVISVPCDEDRRMSTDALRRALRHCRKQDLIPMAVVATAGTTDFGSIDPLPRVAELCGQFNTWMHVDAAYGCGLLVSRRRHLIDGVERADSVTVDYHKSFFQPVSSSAILVRDESTLRHVTYHADYLNPARDGDRVPNQVDKSIQTTRRFDALKLWLTLRIMGADKVGALFDSVIDRADEVWRLLVSDPRFEVRTRPQLSTLTFRCVPTRMASPEACDAANRHARQALADSGEAVVAGTVVDDRAHLKFTLLNPRTSVHDIAEVLELLAQHTSQYLAEQTDSEPIGAHDYAPV